MNEEVKFYTVLDSGKYSETINFLVHNQTQITFKIRSQHTKSKIIAKKNSRHLNIFKFNFQNYEDEAVICSFEINAEKYFFRSIISSNLHDLVLQIPEQIFQLQRRDDFRVIVPAGSSYDCMIQLVDGMPLKLLAEVRDLSLGGCQLIIVKVDFHLQRDSKIEFNFKMGLVERENISCVVRHVHRIQNDKKIAMGLKFQNSDADFLTDMQGLLVQLDRIHRGKVYE